MRVVDFDSLEPSLTVVEGGEPASLPLSGELELLPGERLCVGGSGDEEELCEEEVEGSPTCPEHSSWNPCAACRGVCLKEEMTCHRPHVLYLALFAPDTLKVGVTKLGRFERRMREQGADAGAVQAIYPDGRVVRHVEARAPYRDRITVEEKAEALHEEPDLSLLGPRATEFFYFDGEGPASRPIRLCRGEPVVGRVRGVKGRLLVLERGGTDYCVDLRDLLGYEMDGEVRPVQSSFGSFRGTA